MCPKQYGGRASVPRCHRNPMLPQNSPSHIHRRKTGRRATFVPSGNVTGLPVPSLSTRLARNASASAAMRASLLDNSVRTELRERNIIERRDYVQKDLDTLLRAHA